MKLTLSAILKRLDELTTTVLDLARRVAELEQAHRRDVARDHASPYVCANQEKK